MLALYTLTDHCPLVFRCGCEHLGYEATLWRCCIYCAQPEHHYRPALTRCPVEDSGEVSDATREAVKVEGKEGGGFACIEAV